MKRLLCVLLVGLAPGTLLPQVVPGQKLLEEVDRATRMPDGEWVGILSMTGRDGKRVAWEYRAQVSGPRRLLELSSPTRGLEARVLFLDDGRTIWHWDPRRFELARRRDRERYRLLLASGFAFIDLAGQPLEERFRASVSTPAPAAPAALELRLDAIEPWGYRRVGLLLDGERRPLRVDLHDERGVLERSLRCFYDGAVRRRSTGRVETPFYPPRLEMLDLVRGTATRIEFYEWDDRAVFADEVFDPDRLGR